MSQNEISEFEVKMQSIKEEIKCLERDWDCRKTQLLAEVRGLSTSPSIQPTLTLAHQVIVETLEHIKKKNELDLKLLDTRQTYFRNLQS